MKKTTISLLITILLLVAVVLPASAITDGEPDGEGHPQVGLMVAQDGDGNPLWRCSGTLITGTVFITAGHCTEAPAAHVELWFDSDVEPLVCPRDEAGKYIPGDCYPFKGTYTGTPYTNPNYDPNAFLTYDLGIVVLDDYVDLDTYGELPDVGQFDGKVLKKGTKGTYFTAVGYGLQEAFPDAASWKEVAYKTRMVTYPYLLNVNVGFTDNSMLLSNNPVSGGTCFGDSGGPNFLGKGDGETNLIAGVTSFGMNPRCAGIGGVYRLDRAEDRAWINSFLP